ncbi:lipocalin family protein [Leptospira ellinghausenii]|uniref:lipocalin family protein n=1 Tax=Leptospira ellinghausenii TaxID=1917822 RepID=UPI000D5A0552|nr:lipocalin family protein [Leptospira ellinghausenii]
MEGILPINQKWKQLCFYTLVITFFQCSPSFFPNEKNSSNLENPSLPLISVSLGSYLSPSRFDAYAEKNIDWNRFLGTWIEIKRIDNPFQSGLTNVSAEYSLREDGNIRVKNQGISSNGPTTIEGIALLPDPNFGKLKVSFLYPIFFGDYLILKIDRQGYQSALIGGPESNFLWVFSREKTISQSIETEYILYAQTIGYDTNRLQKF